MGFWADLFGTSGQHVRGRKGQRRREAAPGPYFEGRAKVPPFGTPPRGGAREQAATRKDKGFTPFNAEAQYRRSNAIAGTARKRPR